MLKPFMSQHQICPSNATDMSHIANYFMCTYDITMSVYIAYQLNAINNVTTSTGMHTFHISDICP